MKRLLAARSGELPYHRSDDVNLFARARHCRRNERFTCDSSACNDAKQIVKTQRKVACYTQASAAHHFWHKFTSRLKMANETLHTYVIYIVADNNKIYSIVWTVSLHTISRSVYIALTTQPEWGGWGSEATRVHEYIVG